MSTISGTLKLVRPTQQVTEKFSKREFVVVTLEQYPQSIQLELQGQNCDMIDAYAEGQEIVCDLNIRGRLWQSPQGEDKYFNTLVAWKIQPAKSEGQPEPHHSNHPTNIPSSNMGSPKEFEPIADFKPEEEHDDLPF